MKNFKFDKNRCIFIEVVQNIFLTRYCSFMDQTIYRSPETVYDI